MWTCTLLQHSTLCSWYLYEDLLLESKFANWFSSPLVPREGHWDFPRRTISNYLQFTASVTTGNIILMMNRIWKTLFLNVFIKYYWEPVIHERLWKNNLFSVINSHHYIVVFQGILAFSQNICSFSFVEILLICTFLSVLFQASACITLETKIIFAKFCT